MAARTYAATTARWGGNGAQVPIGAFGMIECLAEQNDGKFVQFTHNPLEETASTLQMGFTYDNQIPFDSRIDSIAYTLRVARDYTPGTLPPDTGFVLGSNIAFSEQQYPLPPVVVGRNAYPIKSDWQTATLTFTNDNDIMDVARIIEWAHIDFALIAEQMTTSPFTRAFLDYVLVTITFTLPTPDSLSTPTFFTVLPNRFSARATFSIAPGSISAAYPYTYFFEYTETNPEADDFESMSYGQGQIFQTRERAVDNVSDQTARQFVALGTTTSTLIPNTTYYARVAVRNADGVVTRGAWAAVTTPQFDAGTSF